MPNFNSSVVVTTPGDAALQLQSTTKPGSVTSLEAVTSNGITQAQLHFQNQFGLVETVSGATVLVLTEDGSVQLGPYAYNHPQALGHLTISGPENQGIVILSTTPAGDPVGSDTRLLSVVSNGVTESQLQFEREFSLVPLGAPQGAGPSLTFTYNKNTGAWQVRLQDNPNKSAFAFDSQSLTFPDGTVQTTAFQLAWIAELQQEIQDLRLQCQIPG